MGWDTPRRASDLRICVRISVGLELGGGAPRASPPAIVFVVALGTNYFQHITAPTIPAQDRGLSPTASVTDAHIRMR
eukprot:scaffold3155_cov358-Prasinococcus_capsulatus_cf.AAC.5